MPKPKNIKGNIEKDSGVTPHAHHEGQANASSHSPISPQHILMEGRPDSDITYSFQKKKLITLHLSQWTPTPTCLQALMDLLSNLRGVTR